ncbi:MAG: DUF4351 domain-containing protein [Planctomycetaceae bacterium]|jgi:hypothetical protein|nr:DUF4351 domain-containing protein [Planctomycetaceae bacterium]
MFISTLAEKYIKGFEEGFEEGVNRSLIEGRVSMILKILNNRFRKVPDSIIRSLNLYTDLIALDSLAESALNCETLEDFEQDLAY